MEEQPYDDRHGYTIDPAFKMPTAAAPPSQPATPPSVLEYEREVYELKKAEFRARQQDEAAAARRAQALELAVRAEVPTVTGKPIRTILETADVFLSYIEGGSTGERPA